MKWAIRIFFVIILAGVVVTIVARGCWESSPPHPGAEQPKGTATASKPTSN